MRELWLYAIVPYLAVAVAAVAVLGRLLTRRGQVERVATRPLPRALTISLGIVLAGHLLGLMAPAAVLRWNMEPARLLLLEATGFAFACLAIGGLVAAAWRRRGGPPAATLLDAVAGALLAVVMVSGVIVAVRYRWGSSWYAATLVPYLRSLITLQPETTALGALPFLARLHVLGSFALVAVVPFSSLATVWLRARGPAASDEAAPPLDARLRRDSRRRALLRAGLAAAALTVVALGTTVAYAMRRVGLSEGYAPPQPLAFTHQLHAGEYQIPCLYCHFGAERSRHAGIPALSVCMNCHAQIVGRSAELAKLKEAVAQERPLAWIQVHNLPDFVSFDHSRHLKSGLLCQECHGAVETMERVRQHAPLTMGWCLDCHRRRRVGAAPIETNGSADLAPTSLLAGTDCSRCHY